MQVKSLLLHSVISLRLGRCTCYAAAPNMHLQSGKNVTINSFCLFARVINLNILPMDFIQISPSVFILSLCYSTLLGLDLALYPMLSMAEVHFCLTSCLVL